MPKREIGGFETYWTTYGQGPRPALLIHCSLAQSGAWRGMAGPLSGALRMTAFDLPGHGRSGSWAADECREVQAVSVAMAAGLLPPEGRVDLIGHSFGATVALRLAVEHPARVRSLTLIEPVFFAVALQDHPELVARYHAEMQPFETAWKSGNRAGAAEAFLATWGGAAPWDSLPAPFQAALAAQVHLIPASHRALHDDVGGVLDKLGGLHAPALLLEGGATHWTIPLILEGLAARLPRAERAVVAGAGHMVPISHPDAVAREVLALVQRS